MIDLGDNKIYWRYCNNRYNNSLIKHLKNTRGYIVHKKLHEAEKFNVNTKEWILQYSSNEFECLVCGELVK